MEFIGDFFANIFNAKIPVYDLDYIISYPYEQRKSIAKDENLSLSYPYHLMELPEWLENYNASHLGPYEKHLLNKLLSSKNGVNAIRGGARSGKSSTLSYLAKFGFDFILHDTNFKNSILFNNFIKIIRFDSSTAKTKDSICKEISEKLQEEFIHSITNINNIKRESYYYEELYEELFAHDELPEDYQMIRSHVRKYYDEEFGTKFKVVRFKETINTLNPDLLLKASLLPYLRLSKRIKKISKSSKRCFILVLDDLDKIPLFLQNYLFVLFSEFFKNPIPSDSGICVSLVMRHGSFVDENYRFDSHDLICHETISPSEICYILITGFLLNSDGYFQKYGSELAPILKIYILNRAFSLWYYLADPFSEFCLTLNALSGTNIESAYTSMRSWLSSNLLSDPSTFKKNYSSTIEQIVSSVSITCILYQYSVCVGRGFAEILNRVLSETTQYTMTNEQLREILRRSTDLIISSGVTIRFIKKENEDPKSYAMRCEVTHKLYERYKEINSIEFKHTLFYKHCVNGFGLGFFELFTHKIKSVEIKDKLISILNFLDTELVEYANKEVSSPKNNCVPDKIIKLLSSIITSGILICKDDDQIYSATKTGLPKFIDNNDGIITPANWINTPKKKVTDGIRDYFIPSSFVASELLVSSSFNSAEGSSFHCGVNVFTPFGHKAIPIVLYIIYFLNYNSKSKDYRSSHDIIEFTKQFHNNEVLIAKTLINMLSLKNGMIFAAPSEKNISYGVLLNRSIDIHLTWSGKLYCEHLVYLPIYLEYALEDIPPLKKATRGSYINHSVITRVEFVLKAMTILCNDEIDIFRSLMNQYSYGAISDLDNISMPDLGIVTDVFIKSSVEFLTILLYFYNRSSSQLKKDIKLLACQWTHEAISITDEISYIFKDTPEGWEVEIREIAKLFKSNFE